tara:strand:- start:111 stop:365 length:255 start_codon:yes stop_codon:yes gene_type:complete
MSSAASYQLSLEEREDLKEVVSYDIQAILGLAELVERSLDKIHRLDDSNIGDVESLSLKLRNLSKMSSNVEERIWDYLNEVENK